MPEKIGPYTLLRSLGEGGMAQVWVARRRDPLGAEKTVVIKRVLEREAGNAKFLDAFIDEARLSARLHHPNIVQVHEVGEEAELPYLALELVDGIDLELLLRALARQGRQLPIAVAVLIAARVLEALAYAHSLTDEAGQPMQVVHRDVSPANVLLGRNGEIKLADFGIAKARGRLTKTAFGMLKGKAPYMSPEQAQGETLDGCSDLFSLGAVLWESLVGRRLFDAGDDLATLRTIRQGLVRPPLELRSEIDAQLNDVVLHLLKKKPADRYQKAEAALAALKLSPAYAESALDELKNLVSEFSNEKLSHLPMPTDLFGDEKALNTLAPTKKKSGRFWIYTVIFIFFTTVLIAVFVLNNRKVETTPLSIATTHPLQNASLIVSPATRGTVVFWDDAPLGNAPQMRTFTPDGKNHALAMLRPGYAPERMNLPFKKPRTIDQKTALTRQSGVVVVSEQARDTWMIAGEQIGAGESLWLPVGNYLIESSTGEKRIVAVENSGKTITIE